MKADAIFVADLHITNKQPICRIDDFWKAVQNKIEFICDLQRKHECPVLCSGDVFHKAKSSPLIEGWVISNLYTEHNFFITIPGNHDLPNHRLDLLKESSLSVLDASGTMIVLYNPEIPYHSYYKNDSEKDLIEVVGFPWNTDFTKEYKIDKFPEVINRKVKRRIALVHDLVYVGDHMWPGLVGYKARSVLRKLKNFDVVVSGHNHQSFTYEHNGRLLVNPGSMTRYAADQIDHEPKVFLYYAETNIVEAVFLPIKEGVISREHLEVKKRKENIKTACIDRLKQAPPNIESFESKMENRLRGDNVRRRTQDFIWSCILDEEGEK